MIAKKEIDANQYELWRDEHHKARYCRRAQAILFVPPVFEPAVCFHDFIPPWAVCFRKVATRLLML